MILISPHPIIQSCIKTEAIGSRSVQKLSHRKISILYSYSYFSKNLLCHPINWLFVKIQLKGMMNKALKGIKTQAESNKDFYYST